MSWQSATMGRDGTCAATHRRCFRSQSPREEGAYPHFFPQAFPSALDRALLCWFACMIPRLPLSPRPDALVRYCRGNEERGITDEMRELCDETYVIPMRGFAESFNLSVGCALTLAYLSSLGGIKHGDLPDEEKEKVGITRLSAGSHPIHLIDLGRSCLEVIS
jgi:hypothetical protein